MTGCVAIRNGVYYVRLSYYDKQHKRKDKFISTGFSGRGAKQKATAMIEPLIEKHKHLEKNDHPTKMADYILMWKNLRKSEVAETTYDGYHTYIDVHLIPYFKKLNLNIQDTTAGHILDYVKYISNDGGRKDNKIGGQSNTSVRKIISILRHVFDYAVLYGDIKIIKMEGEPQYTDREGVVTHIDDAGQIHGTWGGCSIVPGVDTYIILLNIEK